MGRAYSVNGFLNAALRRTGKTILVEGPTDKHVLHRLALEKFRDDAGQPVIDHAGMLNDAQLTGLGNKARVLHVQASAHALSASVPKIAFVLATLTDREWDGLTFNSYCPDPKWEPPVQGPNKFVTAGHSIENYHFDIQCAEEYLKYSFSEAMTAQILDTIKARFDAILVVATVLTLKMRDDSCISKGSGIVDIAHLVYKNGRYYLDASFAVPCAGRQFSAATTIVSDVNLGIDIVWDVLHAYSAVKWLPHGHIGDEIVWVGIAQAAQEAGISADVANEIAHGRKKDRERFKANWLSKAARDKRPPLDDAVEWLHS